MPAPSLTVFAAGDATFTDYLVGWGTIALAVATFLAVLVTIRTARTDRRRDDERRAHDRAEAEQRAHEERERYQRTQARLVVARTPRLEAKNNVPSLWGKVDNFGDRPVLDIHMEAWSVCVPLDGPASWETHTGWLESDYLPTLVLTVPSGITEAEYQSVRAWRHRWTDADGRQWCVDQPQQSEPLPFTGQPPRPS